MVSPDDIHDYIAAGLNCQVLEVTGDGHHFEAVIVSDTFEGLSRIRQHQAVYAVLGERMRAEIHALSLKTFSPEEWEDQS